jgi:hypothetical protein
MLQLITLLLIVGLAKLPLFLVFVAGHALATNPARAHANLRVFGKRTNIDKYIKASKDQHN